MTEARIDFLRRTRPANDPNRCACGCLHASGTDGEDAGCPCSDGHDWYQWPDPSWVKLFTPEQRWELNHDPFLLQESPPDDHSG